jgi:hypothetical protein
MARISLRGFKDPVRRPRYIIWTGVAVLVIAAVAVFAIGVTSTRWFCADGCHKVQDDTIIAYSHSAHSEIACVTCHLPVNSDPITFLIHKVEAGLGVIPTLRNTYELPLNAESEVALSKVKMPEVICTQCHNMKNRKVTPSPGIIIDHAVHSENEITCTTCHNRTAHPENFKLTLPGNGKHQDFMKMTACFRCHSLESGAKAPGKCSACHPKDFKLKPENHLQAGFYPAGHAELAREDTSRVAEAKTAEGEAGTAHAAAAEGEGPRAAEAGEGAEGGGLPTVGSVSYCGTCHVKAEFCDKCHGMQIPHPAAFKEPANPAHPDGHPAVSKTKAGAAKCVMCHQPAKTHFCDNCHHGTYVKWTFDPKVAWQTQHAKAVSTNGVEGCLGKCHQAKFCQDCHNTKKPLPTSHKDPKWLHNQRTVTDIGVKAAAPSATHVAAFQKSASACAVCHGEGGAKAAFCNGCHKLPMPHNDEFKKFHSATGKKNPALCQTCHQFQQICSDCHHKGSTNGVPWLNQHPKTVSSSGAAGCLEKCHKKADCVACHTRTKALPASHKAASWLHGSGATRATHTLVYAKQPDSCTYCHGDGGTKSKFCAGCHKLEMPHPASFGPAQGAAPTKENGGDHMTGFQKGTLSRALCNNCHATPTFCDSCHHKPGYKPGTAWGVAKVGTPQQHPGVVKKQGTAGCFACHKETYCSYCHVRAVR